MALSLRSSALRWHNKVVVRWRHREITDPDLWDLRVRFDDLATHLGDVAEAATRDLETL